MCVCEYVCVCVCACIDTHARIHIYIYIYIYIYIMKCGWAGSKTALFYLIKFFLLTIFIIPLGLTTE